jgi:type IV pilus assembly protein PilN
MTEINLLPWREIKREQEKKRFMMLLLSALIWGAGIVFVINYYASDLVDAQTGRNQRLQEEITRYDGQIAEIKALKQVRDGLVSRMRIVYGLQARRILTVHLFDELIKVLPDGVYLTQVKRTGDNVMVQGYSESNTNVSVLMRNIQKNPWIQEPVLTEIKKADDKTAIVDNEFNLNFILKPKKPPTTKMP